MSQEDKAHAWWSRLRHQGLLLSPVVMLERYPSAPEPASYSATAKLRDARTRFVSTSEARKGDAEIEKRAILAWVDALMDPYIGHSWGRLARQNAIPEMLTAIVRIRTRSETLRPHRVVYADANATVPALLVMADTSATIGRGRGRTEYARFLELLRGTGHRLGLLTNGQQFRLVYAGLDFESWCEWDAGRWFDDGEGSEELAGLRELLSPKSLAPVKAGVSGLLGAVEESRSRQARLSDFLQENIREAIEFLLEEVSKEGRTNSALFTTLVRPGTEAALTDAQVHQALYQATVRLVMRLVVCLFAESRPELRFNGPLYDDSYGVRTLYERLEEAIRHEGGAHALFNRRSAWPHLIALFRLVHDGSFHPDLTFPERGGLLFRAGVADSSDPVTRALNVLEALVPVSDASIHAVLRKLLRARLPVIRGRTKTYVEGPVDYSDLRTQVIGLIYEGLLDYRIKRTDEAIGPMVFLNIGRQPVLPLRRLEDMLAHDRTGLKNLLSTLSKEQVATGGAAEEEDSDEPVEEVEPTAELEEVTEEMPGEEPDSRELEAFRTGETLAAEEAARRWAREAVVLAGLVGRQRARETDAEYQSRLDVEAAKLIRRVTVLGEFYLVRAGNTRKGSGTFYTRPELANPTVYRTLEPLCYDRGAHDTLVPKEPEVILALKVCDSACGSASFLVAGLDYLTEALYRSLCDHRRLNEPEVANRLTLPLGRPRTGRADEEVVKFPPNDLYYGDNFEAWVKARLRRYVVERCLYGVDIDPLAVELARVSLWIATLDPGLPFSFLDHKIKVGNSLVGCWLDRVEDYPLKAWEREGGDGKNGERTGRIETFLKGEKVGNRRPSDGRIKQEMRRLIASRFQGYQSFLDEPNRRPLEVVSRLRDEYQALHEQPLHDPALQEARYREIESSEPRQRLKQAMDEWCAVWFWPTDEESLRHVPTPETFHADPSEARSAIIRRLSSELKFFHWELEFPDVFTPERSEFDALAGNPPWDVIKPNSQEFFSEIDPLYRTYDKQQALLRQSELFASVPRLAEQWDEYNARFKALGNWARNVADPFDLLLARADEGSALASAWARHREQQLAFAEPNHPFRLQGSADLNSYKLFAEVFWSLLRTDGRLGIILPAGIYSDFGTRELRETLLNRGRIDILYAFQNEKRVFTAAHHALKQVALIAAKGGRTTTFRTRFRMGVGDSPEAHEIPEDLLRNDSAAMVSTPEDVQKNSPSSLSLMEIRTQKDFDIIGKLTDRSTPLFDGASERQSLSFGRELHMRDDSKIFRKGKSIEFAGCQINQFGFMCNVGGVIALPLIQGRMTSASIPLPQAYISGTGRSASWLDLTYDNMEFRPQFYVRAVDLNHSRKVKRGCKIAVPGVSNATNARTMLCCLIKDCPTGHSLNILQTKDKLPESMLLITGIINSLSYDYYLRIRLAGLNLSEFILRDTPIPI